MSNLPPSEWRPPQEKMVRRAVTGLSIFALIVGASLVIKATVPTIADAVALLQLLLANTISMALTAGGLVVVLWFLYEALSPKGKINGLFAQAYSSFIHKMTLELLNVDPITPLTDSRRQVADKLDYYDEEFARFDGQISVLKQQEDRFRTASAKAEQQAKAAKRINDEEAFSMAAYKAGSDLEAAEGFAKNAGRLAVIRTVIVRLQSAAKDILYKLDIDIDRTKAEWEAAKSMSAMERAARGIVKDAGKNELAREAQALVRDRYAVAIGRLENLNEAAKPLLQSIDLDRATFSQELLDKWNSEEQAISVPFTVVEPEKVGVITDQSSFRNLIG